jgi:hypothetical protein
MGVMRNDREPTFRDCPHYPYKECQAEEKEPRWSTYIGVDSIYTKHPPKYAKRIRVDPTLLAAQEDQAAIEASKTTTKKLGH